MARTRDPAVRETLRRTAERLKAGSEKAAQKLGYGQKPKESPFTQERGKAARTAEILRGGLGREKVAKKGSEMSVRELRKYQKR